MRALYKGSTETFDWLMEQGYPEYTGEAIVLRHKEQFEPHVVEAAQLTPLVQVRILVPQPPKSQTIPAR
jgi:hypothetical protein